MKLYHFPPAPNPAKVLYYVKEKNLLDLQLVSVDFFKGEQRMPKHLARSPLGTVPVLELDDGTYVTESLPIIEYLEEIYPLPNLIGNTVQQRLSTRSMERFIEMNILLPVMRYVHATNSPIGLPANSDVAKTELSKLSAPLKLLDQRMGVGPFVIGDRVSIADCTLLAAVNFSKFAQLGIWSDYDNIRTWISWYSSRHD